MADREKVINDLSECIDHIRENEFEKIPFWGDCQLAMRDAIELLKEWKPKTGHWFKIRGGTAAQCTICKCWGQINMKFCPWCGAKMET